MPLHILREEAKIDFVGIRKIAFLVSGLIILLGLASLAIKGGPRFGIDFAGGVMVQVKFTAETELPAIQDSLKRTTLPTMTVQRFGGAGDNEYLLRLSSVDIHPEEVRGQINTAFGKSFGEGKFEVQRLEMVGPKVGSDLRTKALEAMFYAVLFIAIYISGRFEQRWWAAGIMAAGLSTAMYLLGLLNVGMSYLTLAAMLVTLALCWKLRLNYALGAVVALVHDVLITVGVFSLLNKEFDLTTVAALLTIIGYSLNDTIIVFDRIRENIRKKLSPNFGVLINRSVNQTLSRTILTSGTTLLVVVFLFFFGGGVIHDFALALLVGIGVGTYSSIFVASPILLTFVPQEEVESGKA